jgi:outer membrane protein assembly factor BamA
MTSLLSSVDLGGAVFVDAGKVWAGDIPFGTTTPVKVGIGVGLLAASPVGSRRTYRVDLAVPVSADKFAKWEVRVSVINIAELGALQEPIDVLFGRELVSTSSSFAFPR